MVINIKGKVISGRTKEGIKGLRVEAWDKELLVSDLVGGTTQAMEESSEYRSMSPGSFSLIADQSTLSRFSAEIILLRIQENRCY